MPDRPADTVAFNQRVYAQYYANPLIAWRYDLLYRAGRIADLLARAEVDLERPGFRAFEYGFGGGHLLRVVAQASSVVGLEMSESAVDQARKLAPPGHPDWDMRQWDDATALPIESESCDLATASHVLEHVEDDETALAELVRILRPGGHLLIILPAHEKLFPGTKHLRVYDPEQFAERLEDMGLQRVAVDEHQRFDRPFKHSFLILQSRRGKLRKLALEGTKVALFLPAALVSWRALAKVDEALAKMGAPSSSVAYLFRKP